MTIEMASLYAGGPSSPNAPASSGWLIKFRVDGDTRVGLSANTIRGGAVVMEDPCQPMTPSTNGCLAVCDVGCACPGDVTDADKSGYVTGQDVVQVVSWLNEFGGKKWEIASGTPNYDECADVTDADKVGYVTGQDVVQIVSWLNEFGGKKWEMACPHGH
jgi:hypothetical protein